MANTRPDITISANTPLDVYAALNAQVGFQSVATGARLRIQNKSGSQIYSHSQPAEPTDGRSGERVAVGHIVETDAMSEGEWLFISSVDGRVSIEVIDEVAEAEVTLSQEEIAYRDGRSYRVDIPLTIPNGAGDIFLKYVVGGDTDLTLSTLECDQGGAEYTVWTAAQASNESGITTAVTVIPKNSKSTAPVRPSHITLTRTASAGSGTLTLTGQQNTTLRVRTAGASGQRLNAVAGEESARGFPSTTVYVRIRQLTGVNTDTIMVLKQEWIEYD